MPGAPGPRRWSLPEACGNSGRKTALLPPRRWRSPVSWAVPAPSSPQVQYHLEAVMAALVKGHLEGPAVIGQGEEVGNQSPAGIIPPGQQFHRLFIGADRPALTDAVSEHGGAGKFEFPEPQAGYVHRPQGPGGAYHDVGPPALEGQESLLKGVLGAYAVKEQVGAALQVAAPQGGGHEPGP